MSVVAACCTVATEHVLACPKACDREQWMKAGGGHWCSVLVQTNGGTADRVMCLATTVHVVCHWSFFMMFFNDSCSVIFVPEYCEWFRGNPISMLNLLGNS